MREQKRRIGIMLPLLLAAALIIALLPEGCANPSTQKIAVKTLASVHDTADAAYKSYISAVLRGEAPTNGVPRVSVAYRDFQMAFALAVLTVNGNTNAAVPQAVFDKAARVTTLIDMVKEN